MTPQPESRIVPTEEEFADWCDSLVTRFVAAGFAKLRDEAREDWNRTSWHLDHAQDPDEFLALRNQAVISANAYSTFLEWTWRNYVGLVSPSALASPKGQNGNAASPGHSRPSEKTSLSDGSNRRRRPYADTRSH